MAQQKNINNALSKNSNDGLSNQSEYPQQVLKEYNLVVDPYNFIVKNNFFVTFEEKRVDDVDNSPLTSTDTQIITTAFKMVHQLNESKTPYDSSTIFKIDLEMFCKMWNIPLTDSDKKNGGIYHNIINSVARLHHRMFRYYDFEDGKTVQSGYFSYIKYNRNTIEFEFPRPFIFYLKKINNFTWYYFENIIHILNNAISLPLASYSSSLYEHLQMNKNFAIINEYGQKEIVFETEYLKRIMAVPKSCLITPEFKRSVLSPAVKHINTYGGLKLDYEAICQGKKITHFKFLCEFDNRDLDFALAVTKQKLERPLLSAQQRKRFAPLLAQHQGYISVYMDPNEPFKSFVTRIEKNLMKNEYVVECWKYLKEIGCRSRKIEAIANGTIKPKLVSKKAEDDNEGNELKF